MKNLKNFQLFLENKDDFNIQDIKSKIVSWLETFPLGATKWSQATDELADVHHRMFTCYSEGLEAGKYEDHYPEDTYWDSRSKTPAEYNRKHRAGILLLLGLLDNKDLIEIYQYFQHWFQ